tara:strand:+ start:566 stop:949 length:384 start_codon:yes stop_codon:yes gene_type:complete
MSKDPEQVIEEEVFLKKWEEALCNANNDLHKEQIFYSLLDIHKTKFFTLYFYDDFHRIREKYPELEQQMDFHLACTKPRKMESVDFVTSLHDKLFEIEKLISNEKYGEAKNKLAKLRFKIPACPAKI